MPQETLLAELKTLRRGRGVQTPRIDTQVGPALRALCGIADDDVPATIRQKLIVKLTELIGELPRDLGRIVATALGLDNNEQKFLQERISAVAAAEQREARTIRRRVDDGFARLVEAALRPRPNGRPARSGRGWHVERFTTILRLDTGTPEAFESRRIVAERDGLDRIEMTWSLPKVPGATPGHDVLMEPYFGAVLVDKQRRTESRFAFTLQLPQTLSIGDRHDFGMMMRLPPGQLMRSHYVFVPERLCEVFELRVRFDPKHLPSQIWRVTEVFHRDIDEQQPGEDVLVPDGVGEISVAFDDMIDGRGYGVQWQDQQD